MAILVEGSMLLILACWLCSSVTNAFSDFARLALSFEGNMLPSGAKNVRGFTVNSNDPIASGWLISPFYFAMIVSRPKSLRAHKQTLRLIYYKYCFMTVNMLIKLKKNELRNDYIYHVVKS